MKKTLRLSLATSLAALPVLALVPGCGGGSGLFPQPTATPTSTTSPTNTPIATGSATPNPTTTTSGTPAPTNTPTNTPRPTATATNTPRPTATATNTPRPTATPTTGLNVDLALAAVSGTPNTPLTPLKSNFKGIYYHSNARSFLETTPNSNPYQHIRITTQGDVHNYTVGQTLNLVPDGFAITGVLYVYEPTAPANTTYTWNNKTQTGNGTITVVAKTANDITLRLTNVIMKPFSEGIGEFSFNGTIRCNITDAPN